MSEMVPMYGFGGGIDNLRFRAYAATSLPASGKENDVCIITSTPIPSWEAGQVDNPTWSMTAGFVYLTSVISYWPESPNLLRKNALYLKLIRCWQYENGTWSSKDAYQYRNGAWVQFSTTFKATIHITYPAGSTCTATDGTTTLTAPDTSGTWDCVVPNAGTWTIKFVDGETEFYSKDIDITENEQSANVAPVFLYYYGNECTGITGGWDTITSKAVFKKYGTYLYAKGVRGTAVGGMRTKLKFNPSGKTIYLDCEPVEGTTIGYIFIQFNLSDNAYTSSPNAQSTVNATLNQRVVTPLDTRKINSAGLIGIMANGNDAVNVYRVWME